MTKNELMVKYQDALNRIKELEVENIYLKTELNMHNQDYHFNKKADSKSPLVEAVTDKVMKVGHQYKSVDNSISNTVKAELFLSLFQGREDVCAIRWKSKTTDKSGYSPYCKNEWIDGICKKRDRIKCSKCTNQNFNLLDHNTLKEHFYGKVTLGIYPINKDNLCKLIVIDFDNEKWEKDVQIIANTCKQYNIPSYIERSRSGEGGHVWFFFKDWIKAAKARKFVSLILDKAMEESTHISFDSYDRIIPTQDFLIKDGFGNLIALPLQGKSRKKENTLFLDEKLQVVKDQWKLLGEVQTISEPSVNEFVDKWKVSNPRW
jgi:hypothetical protein